MDAFRLHQHLIGQQGSRGMLNTPVLLVDLDRLDRNIADMAAFARQHKVGLRPHAKTHKSAEIARRQIAAGALGICCAKLGEAESLAEAGIRGLHITSPVVAPAGIERLLELVRRAPDSTVVVDHPDNVLALAQVASEAQVKLGVVIDIDPGIHRTGVASPQAVLELVQQVRRAAALRYVGVQFYCGRHQHIESYAERRASIEERTAYLSSIIMLLSANEARPPIVTGSGTGTHRIDAELGVFTELQVGSYVFMDRQYNDCDIRGDGTPTFETALQIDARVISSNTPGMCTIDSGLKSMSTEAGVPPILAGAPDGSTFRFMGDEHAAITVPEGARVPALGSTVTLVPPHCDPTVNLYDAYHIVRGNTLVDIWPVTARGRSR